jgi:hypothetical protein
MPSTGTAKAKAKSTPAAPPTVIEVTDGLPHEEVSHVNVGGTLQFDNRDNKDYRIRLFVQKRSKHPIIDVLLSAVGSVTLMADPRAKKKDECAYELLPTDLQRPVGGNAASGGGGKIIIGPTPPAPGGR